MFDAKFFALLSLNISDPVPSYSAKCRLVHLSSLQDRRTTSALVIAATRRVKGYTRFVGKYLTGKRANGMVRRGPS